MTAPASELKRSRQAALTAYRSVIEVLDDEDFMAETFESVRLFQSGERGKTLAEIREEHGLTH